MFARHTIRLPSLALTMSLAALAGPVRSLASVQVAPAASPGTPRLCTSSNRPSPAVMRFLRHHMRQRDPSFRTLDAAHRSAWVQVAMLPPPRSDHGSRGCLLLSYMAPVAESCGTAGCNLDIFESRGTGWRKIGWMALLPPIVLLPSEHLGYPDLGAIGGLRQPSAQDPALVYFDHGRYRMSRTERPAEPKGRVLIDDTADGNAGTRLTW